MKDKFNMKPIQLALAYVLVVLAELAAARLQSNSLAWSHFKREHGKVYANSEEEARRFANFLANGDFVARHNSNASRAAFRMKLNHMADWSWDEFEQLNGFKMSEKRDLSGNEDEKFMKRFAKLLEGTIPDSLDWRQIPNRVSEVRDQGLCGSCWAFSITGLLEGQQAVRNFSQLVMLSKQQLVDCASHNFGCNGGNFVPALRDVHSLGGLEAEVDYRYQGNQGKCRLDRARVVMSAQGGHQLPAGDEETLKRMLANYGPIPAAIDSTLSLWHYDEGIFSDPACLKDRRNHGVLIVGYGTHPSEGDFWIVKNSWSSVWGEQGYFRMKRGVNMCGIAEDAAVADF